MASIIMKVPVPQATNAWAMLEEKEIIGTKGRWLEEHGGILSLSVSRFFLA